MHKKHHWELLVFSVITPSPVHSCQASNKLLHSRDATPRQETMFDQHIVYTTHNLRNGTFHSWDSFSARLRHYHIAERLRSFHPADKHEWSIRNHLGLSLFAVPPLENDMPKKKKTHMTFENRLYYNTCMMRRRVATKYVEQQKLDDISQRLYFARDACKYLTPEKIIQT